jgi:hypothetical protein
MASWNYAPIPGVASVFLVAAVLTGLGLALGATMVFVALASRTSRWPRWFPTVSGFAAFGLMLAAALYVVVALPASLGIPYTGGVVWGFWGSTASFSWGAGWGWYAAVAAAVLFLIAGIVLFCAKTPSTAQAAPKATRQP